MRLGGRWQLPGVLWVLLLAGCRIGVISMPAGSLADRVEEIAVEDGNMYEAEDTPNSIFTDLELTPLTDTGNGRGIVISDCRDSIISNVGIHIADDDALGVLNDCRGTIVSNCDFYKDDYSQLLGHAVLLGGLPITDVPNVTAVQGFGCTISQCNIAGSSRVSGGVYCFVDCTIEVEALYGMDVFGAKINFIRCDFTTKAQPAGAPYWYLPSGPCPVRVAGLSDEGVVNVDVINTSLYFKDCTQDGVAKYGRDLVRLRDPSGYLGAGSVPLHVIKTSLIEE